MLVGKIKTVKMRLYTLAAASAIFAFFTPVLAAPRSLASLVPVEKVKGETSGRYIVRLKPGVNQSSFFDATNIVTTYNWTVINGFAGDLRYSHRDNPFNQIQGEFTEDQIDTLHAHDDVESITEDGITRLAAVETQNNATWGLARLSSVEKLTNQDPTLHDCQFIYETSAGLGVDIYVMDTGIYLDHTEFGGRARLGATFGDYGESLGNGSFHGTHCAGTAAGSSVGVARAASIIAVKVLGQGIGTSG
ncbi:hypothetical protein C0995_013688 [Termitomyces sp. Mi166|nr:hypothetical protein C0995_013688 [Termitomyces sp. Mi166\